MKKFKKFKKFKNFCYVPFRELYYEDVGSGQFNSCCTQKDIHRKNIFDTIDTDWFANSKELKQLRKEFLKGKRPDKCARCWILEEKGVDSYRTQWNKKYKREPIKGIQPRLELLDIRLSNKCNLQCKMCTPGFSDQIAKKQQEMFELGLVDTAPKIETLRPVRDNLLDNMFNHIMNTPSIREIKLAGGEPMIMPEVEEFLIKLITAGRTDIKIFILTNATTVKTSMITTLKQFKHVEISCSIDGVGEWIEYQRAPASWRTISKNYDKLVNSNLFVTLTPCWSHLNLFGIVEYFKWLDTTKVNWVSFNEVTWPSYLSWELIPMKYRYELISQLDDIVFPKNINQDYIGFVNRIKTETRPITNDEREELKKAVVIWDYKSKVKYRDMFPWATELLGE